MQAEARWNANPQEIGASVTLLASKRTSYITGATIARANTRLTRRQISFDRREQSLLERRALR